MQVNQALKCFTVVAMCRALQVKRSAYYAYWRREHVRRPGREATDRVLKQKIRTRHADSHGTYGVNRITFGVKLWYPHVGRRRVYGLMRQLQLKGRRLKKRWRTTVSNGRPHGIQDLVQREFRADQPRQLVVCDVTAMTLASGEAAYLAMVLDVHTRKVVGWDLATTQDARLTVNALKQAAARGPCEAMIVHADQGVQYTAIAFREHCREAGLRQSMSSVGDCYDNAMAESWFATLKKECIRGQRFASLGSLKDALEDYIGYYNADRFHSKLNYQTPNAVEQGFFQSS